MNLMAMAVCVVAQVLDPVPAPTARAVPATVFEWMYADGKAVQATLDRLEGGNASVRDARGKPSTIAIETIVSVWRVSLDHHDQSSRGGRASVPAMDEGEGAAAGNRRVWVIELADGQRLMGELVTSPDVTEAIAIRLPAGMVAAKDTADAAEAIVQVPLDKVMRLWAGSNAARKGAAGTGRSGSDTVWLSNGDVLSGFVAAVGPKIRIETSPASGTAAAKVQELPSDAVARIELTNPPIRGKGALVGFSDGTVLQAAGMLLASEVCEVSPVLKPGMTVRHPVSSIDWILPRAEQWRSLLADAVGPSEALESTGDGVLIREPGTFVWDVRAGETMFVAQVALPPSCYDWGDCTLIVKLGKANGKEVARVHFDAETPAHRLAIPLNGATALELTIDPGASGPVQDRLLLSRAGFVSARAKAAAN
jgi:hypothetical protein